MSTCQQVCEVIREELLGEDIKPTDRLRDIADSLELAAIQVALEDAFGMDIEDVALQQMSTVSDIAQYIDTRSHN